MSLGFALSNFSTHDRAGADTGIRKKGGSGYSNVLKCGVCATFFPSL